MLITLILCDDDNKKICVAFVLHTFAIAVTVGVVDANDEKKVEKKPKYTVLIHIRVSIY